DQGQHVFLLTLKKAGSQTLSVSETTVVASAMALSALALPSIAPTEAESSIMVQPGAAAAFVLAGLPSYIKLNQLYYITGIVLDAYGNLVPNYRSSVHWTSSKRYTTLPKDQIFSGGSQRFRVTFGSRGIQTLTIVDLNNPNLSGSLSNFYVH